MNSGQENQSRAVRLLKLMVPDFKLIFRMWLPLFLFALWFGIYRGFSDFGLFALAMAVGLWSVCDAAVLTYRRLQDYRNERAWRRFLLEQSKDKDKHFR